MLQLLGLSPLAAPLAAKAATDKAIGELSGIQPIGYASALPSLSGGEPTASSSDSWKKKVLRFIANRALPDWLDEELRERNRVVGYLDPDIACKRSWSMNVKITTQRERNIQRARHDAMEGPKRGLRQREFEERYGVWL